MHRAEYVGPHGSSAHRIDIPKRVQSASSSSASDCQGLGSCGQTACVHRDSSSTGKTAYASSCAAKRAPRLEKDELSKRSSYCEAERRLLVPAGPEAAPVRPTRDRVQRARSPPSASAHVRSCGRRAGRKGAARRAKRHEPATTAASRHAARHVIAPALCAAPTQATHA